MMKKYLLFILLICSAAVSAQYQLPNSGFETFVTDDVHGGAGIRPTNWNASNVNQFGMEMTVLTQDNNGHTGNCALLENVTVIGQTSPAWITLGTPWAHVESIAKVNEATAGTDGGTTWTHRPDSVEVWIKRTNNNGEECFIVYYAWTGTFRGDLYKGKNGQCTSTTHYDEESDIRQAYNGNVCGTAVSGTQVAEGHWRNGGTYSTWTKIVVPITYLSNTAPEKMNLILSGGNYPNGRTSDVNQGSKFWVDDLRLIYSSKAHDILLNNRSMTGFDQDTYFYTYTLGATATTIPTITLKRSGRTLDPSEYNINYGAIGDTTTITINAEDGLSSSTYKILFTTQLSQNSRLADIMVDGTSVPGFNPLIFSYNVALPYGTTTYPNITYTFSEQGQSATVNTPSTFPGTATVTCTAPDPAYTTTYSLNFTVAPLTDNTLTDIKVNGRTVNGFRPTRNSYVVELPTGTTADPVITYTTNYPNEHIIVVTNNGISGGATITVTPQGTTNTRTYRLSFIITSSTYSYLNDLKLNGQTIDGWDPETLVYYDTLPIGTTQIPTITWTAGDEYQTISYQPSGIDGTSRVTVTAQAGNSSIYRINFTTLKSTNNALTSILLDGEQIEGWDPDVTTYNIALPVGTTVAPTITWIPGDTLQTITFQDGGLNSPSRIIVKAGNNSTRTYTITFTTSQSSNSQLTALMVGGELVPGWNPATTEYSIVLPQGTTTLPAITWTPGDNFQTIRKVEGGVNGDTRITVKAQNGQSTTYIIHFSVLTNTCNYLNSISIDGTPIANFHRDTLHYNHVLPGGTSVLPAITYVKGDESQTVALTRGGVNGTSTLTVRAEDGSSRVYSISFSVTRSANAYLNNIFVDSVPLPGFDPEVLNYDYVIPVTATSCPQITVDKNEGQSVTITVPSLVGTVRIAVTPETGAQNIYTINIHYPQSSVSTLAGINVDGSPITGFTPEQRNYTYPVVGTVIPTVTGVPADSLQTVHTNTNPATLTSTIYVKAESGDTSIYTVTFVRTTSSVCSLSDLTIDGVTVAGFAPTTYDYSYTLDAMTITAPAIGYSVADAGATVVMTTPALDGTAEIHVTAADGVSNATYRVTMSFVKSSNAALTAVTRNGVAIPAEEFVNDTATLALNYGEAAPTIGYIRGDLNQMVMMASAGLQGTDIVVYAEDSTVRHYSVRYAIPASSNARLQSINIDGFNPNTNTYNITLPWRTRMQPRLEVKPGDEGQRVVINYGGINGATTINVTAEDGVTTNTYTINYSIRKSSVNYLENIYYDGAALPSFDRDMLNYNISLPDGTTTTPKLTWDLALAPDGSDVIEQRVRYIERPINDTSFVIVTAEDGSTRTYSVMFRIIESTLDNYLTMLALNGVPLEGFEPTKLTYNVALPAGTTVMPEISYVKRFDSQTVEISSDGADGVTYIKVLSNRRVNDSTIYTLKSEVSTVSSARLTSVVVDGETLSRFKPTQTSYVLNVTAKPDLELTASTGCQINTISDDNKKMVVEVTDGVNTERYSFFYYYENDVIPNADFSRWSSNQYQGNRPTYWEAPGNLADNHQWGAQRTVIGNEVTALDGGDGIKLKTTRAQASNSIYGSIPGMTTIGTMSLTLDAGGNSTSSVSGQIQFRNTPQQLYVEYNPISNLNDNMDNFRVWVDMFDGSTSKRSLFQGSFDTKNTWQSMYLNIDYTGINNVSGMNICLNSGDSENAKSYGGMIRHVSEVDFRGLHFIYNSALTGATVDGTPIPGFSASTYDYYITLDAEYSGRPKITMTGMVEDQEHRVIWSDWYNGEIMATLRAIAEDGEQLSDYYVHFTRPNSTDNTLKSITLGGTPLAGFSPTTNTYTIPRAAGILSLPDIAVVKGSSHATVTIRRDNSHYYIKVVSESGSSRNYTITFATAGHTESRLAALSVQNHPEVVFNPDTHNYTYTIGAYDGYPHLSFTRANDEQKVDATDTLVTVTAGDGSKTTYAINVVRQTIVPASQLSSITIDGEMIPGFSPATTNYSIDMTGRTSYTYDFSGYNEADNIMNVIHPDTLIIRVSNKRYVINLTRTLSADDNLLFIRQDGTPIPGFSDAIYSYNLTIPYEEAPQFTTRPNASTTVLSLQAAGGGYDVVATAENGTTSHTTNIRFAPQKDTANTLSGIYLNGGLLTRSGEGYTSTLGFRSAVTEYDITLLSDEPKMAQPVMPTISATPTSRDATVTIERGTINTPTIITVRSANGTERDYTLNMTAEKSTNTHLSDLAVDYVTIPGFTPTTASYTYALSSTQEQPVITYTPGDAFQTVTVNSYTSHSEVIVTSESGSTRTYTITYTSSRSSDARINNILIDGTPLSGFNPNVNDYHVQLPIGTTVAPTVTVVAGDDDQSITVNEGGITAPTSVVVTAGDGSTTRFYTVTFDVQQSSVDTLAMIYVNGEQIAGYRGTVLNYTYYLPIGESTIPFVSFDLGDEYQSATLSEDSTNLIASIQVMAQNGSFRNYLVTFYTQESHNAQLQQIFVDGDSLAGFMPDAYSYYMTLPIGTTRIPELTWIEGDLYQQVSYTAATSTDGVATIDVLAGDGISRRTYSVQFHRQRSSNALLESISLNGTPIPEFDPLVFTYYDTLAVMPQIDFIPGDIYQTFDTIQGSLGGSHIIAVHAEDMTTQLYTVNIFPLRSDNAFLADISVEGSTISGFDPEQMGYTVTIPYGTTALPYISYTPAEPGLQNVVPAFALTMNDTTFFYVTAEDGRHTNLYYVTYRAGLSDNANLSDIKVYGETISSHSRLYDADRDFDPDEFIYNIALPNGTDSMPDITYTMQVPDVYSDTLIVDDSAMTATIRVVSQDMLYINEYELRFTVKPSSVAYLVDLQQSDGMLVGFKPQTFDYEITYPQGTDTASLPKPEDITYVKGEPNQTVLVTQNIPTEMVVSVIAEDGLTVNAYYITYHILQSDNSLLQDILINGKSVRNFIPECKDYEYIIQVGDTVPSLIGIPQDSLTQIVDVTMGFVDDYSYIYVTAEDGSYSEYSVLFRTSDVEVTQEPWADDVGFIALGDGYFRASSLRKGVVVTICTVEGQMVKTADVGLVDPNDQLYDPHHGGGTIIHLDKTNKYYIYTFWYNNKRLCSGKFLR